MSLDMYFTSFQIKILKPLMGAEIVDFVYDDEGFVGITVRKNDSETILWISMDPEMNGPGWVIPDKADDCR